WEDRVIIYREGEKMMSIRGFQCLKAAPVLVFCFFVSGWNPQDSAHEMESRASGAGRLRLSCKARFINYYPALMVFPKTFYLCFPL
ncbi:MAG TPA: hypothetical protein PLI34_17400, partial [Saprospiraceae bacterium]|nr:hypothetical protein [Saprospiraceae bacterium]